MSTDSKARDSKTKTTTFFSTKRHYTFLKSHFKRKQIEHVTTTTAMFVGVMPQRICRQSYCRCHRICSRPNFYFIFPTRFFCSYFLFRIGHILNAISLFICLCLYDMFLLFLSHLYLWSGMCVSGEFCVSFTITISACVVPFNFCVVVVPLDCGFTGASDLFFISLCCLLVVIVFVLLLLGKYYCAS